MGRPLPGYDVVLLDPDGQVSATEGEICLRLEDRPLGLTDGYADDEVKTSDVMRDGYYHTGDIASRDSDGYFTFVGRADDVFKASDYRLSPFELESVLIEYPRGCRGRRRAEPRSAAARRAEGVRGAGGRLQPLARARRGDSCALPQPGRPLQTDSADRVCDVAENHLRKDQTH